MERFTIDVSLPNMITIGLVGALVYLVIVGTWSVAFSSPKRAVPSGG